MRIFCKKNIQLDNQQEDVLLNLYNQHLLLMLQLHQFYNEITLNNIESLIVYSTVLARVAKHEKNVLDLFKKEVKSMNDLANEKDIFNVVKTDEVEALKEDVDYINSKINK